MLQMFYLFSPNCMIIYYTMLQMFYLLSPNCMIIYYTMLQMFYLFSPNCMIIYYAMLQMFYLLSPNCMVAVYPECTAPSTSHHAEQDENKADVDQPAKKVSSLTILSSKSLPCKGLLIIVINKTFCSYFY